MQNVKLNIESLPNDFKMTDKETLKLIRDLFEMIKDNNKCCLLDLKVICIDLHQACCNLDRTHNGDWIHAALQQQYRNSSAAPEAALIAAGGAITSLDNEQLIYGKTNFEQGGIIVASSNIKNHKNLCLELKEIINKNDIFAV